MIGDKLRIIRYNLPKAFDHEYPMTSMSIDTKSGHLVSTDEDGKVKVWNWTKQLIRELQFPEVVSTAHFIDQHLDLIIGHANNLSLILAQTFYQE